MVIYDGRLKEGDDYRVGGKYLIIEGEVLMVFKSNIFPIFNERNEYNHPSKPNVYIDFEIHYYQGLWSINAKEVELTYIQTSNHGEHKNTNFLQVFAVKHNVDLRTLSDNVLEIHKNPQLFPDISSLKPTYSYSTFYKLREGFYPVDKKAEELTAFERASTNFTDLEVKEWNPNQEIW